MERLPLNPAELVAEEVAADAALKEEEKRAHARHHQRYAKDHPQQPLLGPDGVAVVPQSYKDQQQEDEDEFQSALARVPSWHSQLTGRGLAVGLVLGALFCVVTHKLNLGPGIIPSLNIAAGLLAFCSLKGWRFLAKRMGWATPAFGAQECNAVQTFVTACSGVAFTGGFGSYVTAMDSRSYELLGPGQPGNRAEDVYEPHLSRLIPYLISTSMIGVFMLVALRKTMIIDYNLTYPSGTATGLMIDSFFTKTGAKTAGSQLTHMARWFGVSVVWDAFKWIYSGTSCAFCSLGVLCGGMEAFPIFGMKAAQWTFYLNLTPNIIGAGMICPHIVNISMLGGAVLTWGILWPWISTKEGDWFPAGQTEHAFGGLFGYKVFITIALLMGDGLYNLIKVLGASAVAYVKLTTQAPKPVYGCSVLGSAPGGGGASGTIVDGKPSSTHSHRAKHGNGVNGAGGKGQQTPVAAAWYPHDSLTGDVTHGEDLLQPLLEGKKASLDIALVNGGGGGGGRRPSQEEGEGSGSQEEGEGSQEGEGVAGKGEAALLAESALEHRLRTHVFLSDTIPSYVCLSGYLGLGLLGTLVIPICYPAVRWFHVVTGFLVGPLMALPVSFGCGLTDWDVSSMMGKLAIFGFAAWAGLQAGGVVTGLAMAGVLLSATSTSATLMQDFRTGYIVKCAPRAMFVAQLMGAAAGALLAPLTFALFWATGKVGDPKGPYPTPYASIFRAMAIFGTQGVGVLPRHCGALMLVFFLGALAINLARDLLPNKYGRFLPIPMAMAIPFVLGAYIAIDMALGSLVLAVWEWLAPESAELLAPAVASGLIVGDGVFSIPLSVMGMLGISAPLCMAFGSQVGR